MKGAVLAFGALLVALLSAWLFGSGSPPGTGEISPAGHGGIESLQLVPFPEGPDSPLFERTPAHDGSVPLSTVVDEIPDPLPAPRWQGLTCGMGGNLVVTFADGQSVTYGPCKRPASIDRLWDSMIAALNAQQWSGGWFRDSTDVGSTRPSGGRRTASSRRASRARHPDHGGRGAGGARTHGAREASASRSWSSSPSGPPPAPAAPAPVLRCLRAAASDPYPSHLGCMPRDVGER